MAFSSGVFIDLPGVVSFCATGALCFTWIWFQSLTIFPALLVIAQRRIESGGNCILACDTRGYKDKEYKFKTQIKDDSTDVEVSFLGTHLAPILSSTAGSILIAVIFIGFSAINASLLGNLDVGLGVTDVVPDDSYVTELVGVMDSHWAGNTLKTIQLVIKGDIYTNADQIAEMHGLWSWVETEDFNTMTVQGRVGMVPGTWYESYMVSLE